MPIRDRKSPYWYARYTDPITGKRRSVSTGTANKREATLIENEIRAQVYRDKHADSYGHKLFEDLMDAWIDHVGNRERDRYAFSALLGHFQGRRLDSISPANVGDYKRRRAAQGAKSATIRKELQTYQAAVNWLNRDCGWNIPNPVAGRLPDKGNSRVRWITFDDYQRLLAACDKRAPYLPDMITLAVNTGMRSGEVRALTWDRVDLSGSVIHLSPENQKNRRYGTIPLNATSRRLLAERFDREQTYVFHRDGRPIGSIRKAFDGACRRAGIQDFVFHDLRHTCASWLIQNGVDLARVCEVLRHSDIRQTMIYAHLAPHDALQAVSVLDEITPTSFPTTTLSQAGNSCPFLSQTWTEAHSNPSVSP